MFLSWLGYPRGPQPPVPGNDRGGSIPASLPRRPGRAGGASSLLPSPASSPGARGGAPSWRWPALSLRPAWTRAEQTPTCIRAVEKDVLLRALASCRSPVLCTSLVGQGWHCHTRTSVQLARRTVSPGDGGTEHVSKGAVTPGSLRTSLWCRAGKFYRIPLDEGLVLHSSRDGDSD